MTVEPASGDLGETVEVRNVIGREEGSEDVADEAADGVLGENVQRIVDAQDELEFGGVIGAGGTHDAVDDCRPGGHEAGSRGDGDQAGHHAGAEAHGGPLALEAVVEDAPGDAADTSGEVGDDGCHDRAHVGREGRACVETEPADPEEDGADDDVRDIVWAVVQFVSSYVIVLVPRILWQLREFGVGYFSP